MSESEILICGRVIERLLIVLIYGASLGFGWNLFREGVVKQQQAEFSHGQWKITLKQVGPGVFFALFGCFGLLFATYSGLSLSPTPGTQNQGEPKPAALNVHYDAPEGVDRVTRDEIKAINTLTLLWNSDRSPNVAKPEVDAGNLASKILRDRKETLLHVSYPQDYDKYKEIRSKVTTNPEILDTLSPEQRKQYKDIEDLDNGNLMDGPSN